MLSRIAQYAKKDRALIRGSSGPLSGSADVNNESSSVINFTLHLWSAAIVSPNSFQIKSPAELNCPNVPDSKASARRLNFYWSFLKPPGKQESPDIIEASIVFGSVSARSATVTTFASSWGHCNVMLVLRLPMIFGVGTQVETVSCLTETAKTESNSLFTYKAKSKIS